MVKSVDITTKSYRDNKEIKLGKLYRTKWGIVLAVEYSWLTSWNGNGANRGLVISLLSSPEETMIVSLLEAVNTFVDVWRGYRR